MIIRETIELGKEIHLGKGVLKRKFSNTRKLSHWQVWGKFLKLKGQPNWEEKYIKPTDYMPKRNSQ